MYNNAFLETVEGQDIDQFKVLLDKNEYKCVKPKNSIYNTHVGLSSQEGMFALTIRGKFVAEHNSLVGITEDKMDLVCENLEKIGVITTKEMLLNAPLRLLDTKQDISIGNQKVTDVLSTMREMVYLRTSKNDVISYDSKNGRRETSILIKSSCRTIRDSLSIYDKTQEILDNKRNDPEYYVNFSTEFFSSGKILRFERRLGNSSAIKKAISFNRRGSATLQDVFNYQGSIIGEKVAKCFGKEILR